MKADQSGTWTEQVRFKREWLSPQERNKKGLVQKCGDCGSIDKNHGAFCSLGRFSTQVNAVCASFVPRSAEDI